MCTPLVHAYSTPIVLKLGYAQALSYLGSLLRGHPLCSIYMHHIFSMSTANGKTTLEFCVLQDT